MLLAQFDFQDSPLEFYRAPNGEPVVSAGSIVLALKGDAANAARIARNNVRAKWLIEIPTPNGGKPKLCIFEPGVYQLAGNPMFQTELAEMFQDWLFEKILPKLRTSSGVILPGATSEQLQALQNDIDDQRRLIIEQAQKIESLEATQRSLLSSTALSYLTAKQFAESVYIRDLSFTTQENERQHKYPLKCTKAIQQSFCVQFSDYFATSQKFKDLCDRLQLDPKFVFPDFGLVSEYNPASQFPAWSMVWFLENIFAPKYPILRYNTDFVQNSKLAIAN